jgi:hypothetical protein
MLFGLDSYIQKTVKVLFTRLPRVKNMMKVLPRFVLATTSPKPTVDVVAMTR